MSERDGGLAFPLTESFVNSGGHRMVGKRHAGMTLLEYFAAHCIVEVEDDGCVPERLARAVMDSEPPKWENEGGIYGPSRAALEWWFEAEARLKFMKANAMLKARDA